MKIEKFESVDVSVTVDVSAEDIASHIFSESESLPSVLRALNNVACALKGIPDERIAEMTDVQREMVETFLREQAARYGPVSRLEKCDGERDSSKRKTDEAGGGPSL